MKKKSQAPISREEYPATQNSALAELLKAQGFTTSVAPESPAATPTPRHDRLDAVLGRAGKIVLRREKKGRGGKTVTVVSGLALPSPMMEELARALRKGLGCGSTSENGHLILQGDITDRAARWLREHGAKTVMIGN